MQAYLYLPNISFCLSILGRLFLCDLWTHLAEGQPPPFSAALSSQGTQKEKLHLESFIFQFLISWITLKVVLSSLPEWQLFISLEGEILNITFSFITKMILFIWAGVYSVLFICPNTLNITSVLQKCSALSLWIRPPCQACHISDISVAFCSYMVIEISKVPYRTWPIFIPCKNDWLSQWYSSYSSQHSCRMCSIPMEQVRKYKT